LTNSWFGHADLQTLIQDERIGCEVDKLRYGLIAVKVINHPGDDMTLVFKAR
jgi:hypothetical protein